MLTISSASSCVARRCVNSQCLPTGPVVRKILELDTRRATALTVTEFLNRSKLGQKLDTACKLKAERDKREKKNEVLILEILTGRN